MDGNRISSQQQREHADPSEGTMPVPTGVLLLIACLMLFGITYILSEDLSSPELGDRRTIADLMPQAAAAKAATVDGAALYAARCAPCHQASGAGVPGVFPPLAGSEWVTGKPDVIPKIVLHGVSGTLTVKGGTFNGAMPGFKDQLKDDEIAALATHVRSQWGNKADPVTQDVVAKARAETAGRSEPWNGDAELEALK